MSGFEILAKSPKETTLAAFKLGQILEPGDCIALTGELGAGKTHFTKGVAQGLGIVESVLSPTFNLMLEYPGRLTLRHLDAYFASRESALLDESCAEVFGTDGVAIVEWAERVSAYLPPSRLEIRLELAGEDRRRILAIGKGERGKALAEAWKRSLDDGERLFP